MIIAVDFDGTLWIDGMPNIPLLTHLANSQRNGDIIILWTCREGKSLQEALQLLLGVGFRPNYVNQNCPQGLKRLGHDSRKIYADIYIDDKGRN